MMEHYPEKPFLWEKPTKSDIILKQGELFPEADRMVIFCTSAVLFPEVLNFSFCEETQQSKNYRWNN